MTEPFDTTDPLTGLTPLDSGPLAPSAIPPIPEPEAQPAIPAQAQAQAQAQPVTPAGYQTLFQWRPQPAEVGDALMHYHAYLDGILALQDKPEEMTSDTRQVLTARLLVALRRLAVALAGNDFLNVNGVLVWYDGSFVNPVFEFVSVPARG